MTLFFLGKSFQLKKKGEEGEDEKKSHEAFKVLKSFMGL